MEPLWIAFKERHEEDARRRLVENYVGLVKYVAGRMAVGLPHYLEFTDLYSAGLVGLIQAVDHFDHQRGIKFETYAVPRIRGSILDELRAQDWFPRSLRRKARQLEEAYAVLEMKLGRPVSDEEIAAELDISVKDFDRWVGEVAVATIVSLDSEGDDTGGTPMVDTLADPNHVVADEAVADGEMRQAVVEVLADLPEKDRLVLTLYYYEELTLREIGEVLEVTESRVCQIHTKAILRLRGKLHRKLNQKPIARLGAEVAAAMKQKVQV